VEYSGKREAHQTPRTENGIEYGDFEKYLNFAFMGDVARDNAEALRQLALAPAPPANAKLTGAVTSDAKVSWSAEEDPERAGFEILWRETTDPRWTVYGFAAAPGETVLKGVSTDSHFFAVRAWAKMALARLPNPRKSSGGRRRTLHRPNSDPLSVTGNQNSGTAERGDRHGRCKIGVVRLSQVRRAVSG
jgi:hypothetical protein